MPHHPPHNYPKNVKKLDAQDGTPVTVAGVGFNNFFSSAMPTVIDASTSGGEGSIEANVYICTSTQQVLNSLGVNASIAVSSPWGSFKDRLEFVSSLKTTTTTVVILATATLVRDSSSVTGATFYTPFTKAADLYARGGDSYVSSIATGGQYMAAYSFHAYDEETFQSVVNSADANFSGLSSSFSASFDTSIKNIAQTTNVTSQFDQYGVGFSCSRLPTQDKMVDFVLNFGTMELDAPALISFTTTPYRSIPGCPSDFDQIYQYLNEYIDPTNSGNGYSDIEFMAKTSLAIIKDVAQTYNYYGLGSIDPRFGTIPSDLHQIVDSISTWRTEVDSNPVSTTINPPAINTANLLQPTANFALIPGSFVAGGDGGGPFQDITPQMISWCIAPASITIWGDSSSWLSRIQMTWETQDPNQPSFTHTWGSGQLGIGYPTIQLGPGEKITQLGAAYSPTQYLCRLSVTTSQQPTIIYPDGNSGGGIQTWTPPANSSFVGFSGRGGAVIDQIRPVYVQFAPATWTNPYFSSKLFSPTQLTHFPTQLTHFPPESDLVPSYPDHSSDRSPNEEEVLSLIGNWAQANYKAIQQVYLQRGGWEGWMQVNIAMLLNEFYPNVIMQREEHVYTGSNMRADLTFKIAGEPTQVVELKVESLWQDASAGVSGFLAAYKKDIDKISNNQLVASLRPAKMYVIGLTCKDQVFQYMRNLDNWYPYAKAFKYTCLVPTTGTEDALYMWWVVKSRRA